MLALFYDTETTGLPLWRERSDHVGQPHIVQLAAKLIDLQTRECLKSMDVLVQPIGWICSPEALAVHGITQERAMDEGIPELQAIEQLLAMWDGCSLVGHNEQFDRRIVRIGLKRHLDTITPEGKEMPSERWAAAASKCTMRMAGPLYTAAQHAAGKKSKAVSLGEAHQLLLGKPLEGAHNAMADVDGCVAIYFAMQAPPAVTSLAPDAPAPAVFDRPF